MMSLRWMKLVAVCGALMAAGLGCDDGGDSGGGSQPISGAGAGGMSSGAGGAAGTGSGGTGVSGVGGAAGSAGVMATGGASGAGGAAGMMVSGGAGGTMASAGAGGMMATGGAGGMMAAGGAGGMGAGGIDAQCMTDVVGSGRDMACAACACANGTGCVPEIAKIHGQQLALDMLACTKMANCGGECCLCNGPCDAGGANYGMGPCTEEIETAAGVTPGLGALFNGMAVSMACNVEMAPADAVCGNTSRVGACVETKCKAECMSPTCM